jgi:hypothetical protein
MTMISNPRERYYDYYTPNAHTKYNLEINEKILVPLVVV